MKSDRILGLGMVFLLREMNAAIVVQLKKRLILGKFVGLLCFLKARNLETVNNDFFLYPGTKFCLFWNKWKPRPDSGVEGNGSGCMEVAGMRQEDDGE